MVLDILPPAISRQQRQPAVWEQGRTGAVGVPIDSGWVLAAGRPLVPESTWLKGTRMELPVQVTTRGEVGRKSQEYAITKITRSARFAQAPILFARIKLIVERDPARARPAIAQALLDVNGTPVPAHVAAHDLAEAIDLLADRLRHRLEHLAERQQALRKRGPGARQTHEWRRGDRPTPRPPYFDRPAEDRQVVRQKTFALDHLSPVEAAEEMDRLGYDFHLFPCAATGAVCVVARQADGGGSVVGTGPLSRLPDGFVADPTPTPTLHEPQALKLLDLSDAPFVFYRDAATGVGTVVYHRDDGHYGLIASELPARSSDVKAAR